MKEEDIRPVKIFDEYLELAKKDTQNYFADSEKKNINFIDDKFWKYFLSMASDRDLEIMQKAIQDTLLSSHIMVTCQKI